GPGEDGQRTRFSDNDFNAGGLCRNTGVRQPRTIWGGRLGYPFGSLLARAGPLEDGDRPCAVYGFTRRGDVSSSACATTAEATRKCSADGAFAAGNAFIYMC